MFIVWGRYHFFKRNRRQFISRCVSCQRVAAQDSFDTIAWAHLYFIPLLPMGRKRILAKCTSCAMFTQTSLTIWQAERSAALYAVEQRYGREPAQLDYALEALELLGRFGEDDKADAVATHLERTFLEEANVRARLADWHTKRNRLNKASELIAPSSTDANHDDTERTLAAAALVARNYPLAKQHMLAIKELDTKQDFFLLANLAQALSETGQEQDAYKVCVLLFTKLPDSASRHSLLVTLTRKLETKLRIATSVLPKTVNSRKDYWIGAAIVAAFALVIGVVNEGLRARQTLFVTNPTQSPAIIRVAEEIFTLPPASMAQTTLAEGQHRVIVRLDNGQSYDTQIEISNDFSQRLGQKSVFVFNAFGADAFMQEVIVYQRQSEKASDTPGPYMQGLRI